MNETRRTVTYVAAAVIMAFVAWWLSPPVEITPAELQAAKIGTPLFDDFNPTEATSIRVVAFDEAKATYRSFGVKFENGKWTIPSHHNYPADGADRLAKTATSVKGIHREELAVGGETEQGHEQLGVIDPLDEDRAKLKGRGQRITLSKGDDTLVDLIIGKQLKDRPGFYYIRKPGENATYIAKLQIDLSTKFQDWVETDLLKINRDDLKEVVMDNYSIDEAKGVIVPGEINKLTRDKSADPWKLDGLDEATEELDTSKINSMVGALDDLKLVGVRPKPKGLRVDLTLDREIVRTQAEFMNILGDLQRRGFFLVAGKESKEARLVSNEGELIAATSKGVVYTLRFGEIFTGDEAEIEIGGGKEEADDTKKKSGDEAAGKKEDANKDQAAESKQPSRYLFVSTQFNADFLGPRPEEPEKPAGLPDADDDDESAKGESKGQAAKADDGGKSDPAKPEKQDKDCGPPSIAADESEAAAPDDKSSKPESTADKEKKEGDDAADESQEKADKPKEPPAAPESKAGEKGGPKAEGAESKPAAEKQKSAEELKKEYDDKVRKYKSDLKAYDDKVEAGKKLVDELNARFGDWYYVISSENFNKLHLGRKDLVKEKNKSAGDGKNEKTGEKAQDPFDLNGAKPAPKEKDNPAEEADKADDDASASDSAEKDSDAAPEKKPESAGK